VNLSSFLLSRELPASVASSKALKNFLLVSIRLDLRNQVATRGCRQSGGNSADQLDGARGDEDNKYREDDNIAIIVVSDVVFQCHQSLLLQRHPRWRKKMV
jgi:hypothetical protein